MKKQYIIVLAMSVACLALFVLLTPNKPFEIVTPENLTVEKIIDPFQNIKDNDLYYISEDKGYFNLEIENKLNTKSISAGNSSSYKNVTTMAKAQLLQALSGKIETVYYQASDWWSIDDRSDSYAAIFKGKNGENYITGVFGGCKPYTKK